MTDFDFLQRKLHEIAESGRQAAQRHLDDVALGTAPMRASRALDVPDVDLVLAEFASLGKPWFKYCLWLDVQRRQKHVASRDYKTLIANMQASCRVISRGWDDIEEPPGFDPDFAKFQP